jgi:Restriction endonuclease
VKKWQEFEQLIAAIHRLINSADYDVESNVKLTEASGASHQIDVLVRPKTNFAGPVLVSCKAWTEAVGIDHIREWSDIVQHTGAASGVIVAQFGFTAGAIEGARNPERRVSLWKPRLLTEADFGPDVESPTGYIARIGVTGTVSVPQLVHETFKLDATRADGMNEGRDVLFNLSFASRDHWYLRDEQDNVVGNLWDMFVVAAESAAGSALHEIVPEEARFLVIDGIRFRLNGLSFGIEVIEHERHVDIDLRDHAIGYENVLTKHVEFVPLPHLKCAFGPID